MSSRILRPVIMFFCVGALVSIIFAGCGSATLSEYEQEVTALNELAAEKMAEVSEALAGGSHEDEGSQETEGSDAEGESPEAEGSHEDEGETPEALVVALEEVIESLKMVILELEDVKVPEGMEELHRSILAFYEGNLSTYEVLLATLEPGEAHGEEEETTEHEEVTEEGHEEETSTGGH